MLAIAAACGSGQIPAEVCIVIADTPDAGGIERARASGLATRIVDRRQFTSAGKASRPAFEATLAQVIGESRADYIILAGFMRILSADFIAPMEGRMLNIHPSLLPRHKGLDTHARVLAAGDPEHGATVHFVTAELDGGPLIAQAVVPVLAGDSVAALSGRVHAVEHKLYPMVIEWLTRGRLAWNGGNPTLDGTVLRAPVRVQ